MTTEERDFLESLAIGAACKALSVRKKLPIAYSYNGTILPKLPELSAEDKEIYRHLVISEYFGLHYAYACASLTAEPTNSSSGGTYYAVTTETPFLMCMIQLNFLSRIEWSEWEMVSDSAKFRFYSDTWTNHDIVALDGTTPYAGSEPTPVYLPCVLCDKEVITKDDGYGTYYSFHAPTDFTYGDILRITINDVTGEYMVKGKETNVEPYVGNGWLIVSDREDEGGDWAFSMKKGLSPYYQCVFYTRAAGTYQLKIELIEQAKE